MGTLALRLSHRTRPTEIGKQQNWVTYALRPDRYGFVNVRDGTVIDSELRLRARLFRRSIREHGGEPSSRQVDELLDERLAHRARRESGVLERSRHKASSALLYVRPGVS